MTEHAKAVPNPVDWQLAGKIAVGFFAGAIVMGIVAPIAAAIVIGLIWGHH